MRLARFGNNRLGLVEADTLCDVTSVLEQLPALRWPVPIGDQLIANLPTLAAGIRTAAGNAPRQPLAGATLLSPVANPPRIIAAPVNYRAHQAEAANPQIHHGMDVYKSEGFDTPIDKFGLFLKSQTGVVGPGEGIEIAFPGRRNDHEVELAAVIGRTVKNVDRADALDCVAGYCIGLDITVRGPQDRSFRKSADSYTVLGPWLVTADEIPDPGTLDLRLTVNGEVRQDANTRDLIVDVPDLIARVSRVYTLHPGDVILTGTPEGVSPIEPGTTIVAAIEKIGEMTVKVR